MATSSATLLLQFETCDSANLLHTIVESSLAQFREIGLRDFHSHVTLSNSVLVIVRERYSLR